MINPLEKLKIRDSVDRIDLDVMCMTYVFGGGVTTHPYDARLSPNQQKPSKPYDEVTPIRSSSVRGQLRFWWRATVGARCATYEEMKSAEAERFGAIWTETPTCGAVGLTVDSEHIQPEAMPCFVWDGRKKYPKDNTNMRVINYGAFPLRPNQVKGHVPAQSADVSSSLWNYNNDAFKVALDFPKKWRQEMILALSAWLTFGGYGGRLSRGFGSVKIKSLPENAKGLVDEPDGFFELLNRYEQSSGQCQLLDGVPAISTDRKRCVVLKKSISAHDAWCTALQSFREFRQGRGLGRNPPQPDSKSPAGRSRFPEPDAIRRLSQVSSSVHKPEHRAGNVFPRGAFGLPIIFHFNSTTEPEDHTLQVSGDTDRAPSPLILRSTSKGCAMALWLCGMDVPEEMYLNGHRVYQRGDTVHLPDKQQRLIEPNVIEQFLTHFQKPFEPMR